MEIFNFSSGYQSTSDHFLDKNAIIVGILKSSFFVLDNVMKEICHCVTQTWGIPQFSDIFLCKSSTGALIKIKLQYTVIEEIIPLWFAITKITFLYTQWRHFATLTNLELILDGFLFSLSVEMQQLGFRRIEHDFSDLNGLLNS